MSPNRHRSAFLVGGLLCAVITPTASVCRAVVTFTNINAGLPGTFIGAAVWGDYDGDGDLDLLLTGDSVEGPITRVYRNSSGTFSNTNFTLASLDNSSAAWGDYDNDGDLDILAMGRDSGGLYVAKLYRNLGVFGFVEVAAGLPGIAGNSATWADYDNDGDLDIFLTGSDNAYQPASRLIRNDGAGVFTPVATGIVQVGGSSAAWGDYDNDGDLDLLLAGFQQPGFVVTTRVYRNDGGVFTDIAAGLLGSAWGSVAWGDYDCDRDLDILLTGYQSAGQLISCVYRNDGAGVFTDIGVPLLGMDNSSAVWGDYDNDGDDDILLAGVNTVYDPVARLYRNNGGGSFVEVGTGLLQLGEGSVAWGDYDNDGDLDILQIGRGTFGTLGAVVYRSDGAPANTLPATPGELSSTVLGDGVQLSWHACTDGQTPSAGLSYNLRIGTTPGGSEIMSAMANPTSGLRRLAALGNTQERTSWIVDVRAETYYWSVQAVDGAFAGSPFAAEQVAALSGVESPETPLPVRLASSAPNPFRRSTAISFELTAAAWVRLAVFDASGRCVRVLLNEQRGLGEHTVDWDGTNDRGQAVGSGFYLCRLDVGGAAETRSILRIE